MGFWLYPVSAVYAQICQNKLHVELLYLLPIAQKLAFFILASFYMSKLDHRQAKVLVYVILDLLQIASNANPSKMPIVQLSFPGLITRSIGICHNKPSPQYFLSVINMHLPRVAIFLAGLAKTSGTAFLRMTCSLLF